jgi:hypothetical protein
VNGAREGSLKARTKCAGRAEEDGGGKIMKMAACNFLIASHFTIKFIRFFSLLSLSGDVVFLLPLHPSAQAQARAL